MRTRLFHRANAELYGASNKRHVLIAWRKSGFHPYDLKVVLDNPTAVNTLPIPKNPTRDAVPISGCFTTSPEKVRELNSQSELRKQKRAPKKAKQAQKLEDKKSSRGPKIKNHSCLTAKSESKKSLRTISIDVELLKFDFCGVFLVFDEGSTIRTWVHDKGNTSTEKIPKV